MNLPNPIITTQRVTLTAFTPEVYHHAFTNLSENAIMELFGHQNQKEFLIEKDRFDKGMTTFNKSFLFFQLRDKTNNEFLGWAGYHTWYMTHNRAELFYMLIHERHRKIGLMTEVLPVVLDYGFNQLELERIEAFAATDNVPSLALLNKFGFKKEGLFRKHYRLDGINTDSLAFGLLKEEYIKTP
jgi:[ribosomal protein S5]-alanine N-acetyltransferase